MGSGNSGVAIVNSFVFNESFGKKKLVPVSIPQGLSKDTERSSSEKQSKELQSWKYRYCLKQVDLLLRTVV